MWSGISQKLRAVVGVREADQQQRAIAARLKTEQIAGGALLGIGAVSRRRWGLAWGRVIATAMRVRF